MVIYGIHKLQFNRQAEFFGDQASQALANADYANAIRLYHQSLLMEPQNAGLLRGLAEAYERVGNVNSAYKFSQQLNRLQPDDRNNLIRLSRVSLRLRRFGDAISGLNNLLEDEAASPPNIDTSSLKASSTLPPLEGQNRTELLELLGDAKAGDRDGDGAIQAYKDAIKNDNAAIIVHAKLADAMTKFTGNIDAARSVIESMVRRFPDDPTSHIAAGKWYLKRAIEISNQNAIGSRDQSLARAAEESKTAIKLAADQGSGPTENSTDPNRNQLASAIEFAAEVAAAQGDYQSSLTIAQSGIEKFPDRSQSYTLAHSALTQLASLADADDRLQMQEKATEILRIGVQRIPNVLSLQWTLANDHLEHDRIEKATESLATLRKLQLPPSLVRYLESRLLAEGGDVNRAAIEMERVRSEIIERPELVRLVDLTLGDLYQQMGDVDRQIAALRRVVSSDPGFLPGRERLAFALMQSGRLDEAVQEYRIVSERPDVPIRAPLNYARLLLMQTLSKEPAQRDWSRLQQLLSALKNEPSFSTDIALLTAEILVAQRQPDLARKVIQDAPQNSRTWAARVLLEVAEKQYQAAIEVAGRAKSAVGDIPAIRAAVATALVASNADGANQSLRELSRPLKKWDDSQRMELAKSLVPLLITAKRFDDARQLATIAAALSSNDVVTRLQLMQIAFETGDAQLLRKQLDDLQKITGRDSRWYYGNAMAIAIEGQAKTDLQTAAAFKRPDSPSENVAVIQEINAQTNRLAQESLAEAAVLRPDWELVPGFSAFLHDKAGNLDSAIIKYDQAINLGWRNASSIRRLIELLTRRERFGEADSVIRRLRGGNQPFTSEMARIASEVSVEMADLNRAVRLAEEAARASRKSEDFLWFGNLSELTDNDSQAEKAYRSAIRAAPDSAAATLAWIGFLERNARLDEARQSLELYERNIDEADTASLLVLADGYQRIGSIDDAARILQRIIADDLSSLQQYQQYYRIVRTASGPDASRQLLRQWTQRQTTDPQIVIWSRRELAYSLASTGDPNIYQNAKQLILQNMDQLQSTQTAANPLEIFDDRRVMAIIEAIFTGNNQPEIAISQFETLIKDGWQPSISDQFTLGQLYASNDNWIRGRRLMLPLLSNEEQRQPVHIKTYVRRLISQNDAAEAQLWLDRLQSSDVRDADVAAMTAEVLLRRGNIERLLRLITIKPDEVASADTEVQWFATTLGYPQRFELLSNLITDLIERSDSKPTDSSGDQTAGRTNSSRIASSTADTNPTISRLRDAAQVMSNGLDQSGEFPGLFYARQLLKRGECDKAVSTIALAVDDASLEELISLAELVLAEASCEGSFRDLEKIFARKSDGEATDLVYSIILARLREASGDYKAAIDTYESVLRRDADQFAAKNNVAMLLALQKRDLDRANTYINQLINATGETMVTLDTRGVCRLASGDPRGAKSDFDAAMAIFPHPVIRFHQAQTAAAEGQIAVATDLFRQAQAMGLKKGDLHPLERSQYDQWINQNRPL